MKDRSDNIRQDRRQTSILMDRSRHDVLAWIKPNAVESYALYFAEADRLKKLAQDEVDARVAAGDTRPVKPLGEFMTEWADQNLIMSASRQGWRGDTIGMILAGGMDGDPDKELTKALRVPTNGS